MERTSSPSSALIEVRNVVQTFRSGFFLKPVMVLKDISFSVRKGSVFGLLGPNGAGKTTLIHVLSGIRNPTGGEAKVLGGRANDPSTRKRIGYLPERPYFYDHLTGQQFMEFVAKLLGLPESDALKQIGSLLERVGLSAAKDRELRHYSKGMLQRIGFAQTLLGSPDLLILDEPMSGMDPVGRREMRDLILDAHKEGRSILLSSHILSDIETLCSEVVILRKGEVVESGRLEELSSAQGVPYEAVVRGLALPVFKKTPKAMPSQGYMKVMFESAAEANEALGVLMREGYEVKSFGPMSSVLEKWFERETEGPPS